MNETTILGSIGAGNMAGAMVEGWLRADPALAGRILVTDRGSGRAARLAERLGVQHVADNAELVRRADVVLIAVKPIDVERVLREASELIDPAPPSSRSRRASPRPRSRTCSSRACRCSAACRTSASRSARARSASRAGRSRARRPRLACSAGSGQIGTVVTLEERLFDAATALAGSGPAFLGLVIEAFEDAGITTGLSAATARELILSTMVGTANVLEETGVSCSDLRRMVTSPGAPLRPGWRRWSGPRCAAASSTACSPRSPARDSWADEQRTVDT